MAAGLRAANQNIVFLPTACLQLLQTIAVSRPHHVIIASDFDALPDVTIAGVSAPLVASQVGTFASSMPAAFSDATSGGVLKAKMWARASAAESWPDRRPHQSAGAKRRHLPPHQLPSALEPVRMGCRWVAGLISVYDCHHDQNEQSLLPCRTRRANIMAKQCQFYAAACKHEGHPDQKCL